MSCEIKVLIELYRPTDTGVIIWTTNIIGKIDYIAFYLLSIPGSIVIWPFSLFPRDIHIDVISMYFIFTRTFDLVSIFFFPFFYFSVTDRQVRTDLSQFLMPNNLRLANSLW